MSGGLIAEVEGDTIHPRHRCSPPTYRAGRHTVATEAPGSVWICGCGHRWKSVKAHWLDGSTVATSPAQQRRFPMKKRLLSLVAVAALALVGCDYTHPNGCVEFLGDPAAGRHPPLRAGHR